MTQPRELDLSGVAQEPADESVAEEKDILGNQPDTGDLVSEDDAQ
ncbi:MAG TPA: hypothetical protein VEY14_02125 [Nocardioidaceae bacterium]|jgi:hypothetical protein|nr:hypothetical protein [Nocardioidaceae bacterium]